MNFDFNSLSSETLQAISVWSILIIIVGFRVFRFYRVKRQLPALMADGGTMIDVRTAKEFERGHGRAINLPLNEINEQISTLKLDKTKPVILCCANGSRSAVAAGIFRRAGYERVFNAGSWRSTR